LNWQIEKPKRNHPPQCRPGSVLLGTKFNEIANFNAIWAMFQQSAKLKLPPQWQLNNKKAKVKWIAMVCWPCHAKSICQLPISISYHC